MTNRLEVLLKTSFGYDTFRPPQREIIERVLGGEDTLVLMPTGGGKSLCYQLPTLLMDGMTVVISPLIALMKDQVGALHGSGITAAYLNSSLSAAEEQTLIRDIQDGQIKLLYVSPERVFSSGFLDFLHTLPITLFAIDEAHCVSSWGHQFRPDYRNLHVIKAEFPTVPVIALTATADRAVRHDMKELLGIPTAKTYISSFDRPNLSLAILPGQRKWEQLQPLLKRHKGHAGIIYCSTRKQTEELANKLNKAGYKAAHYHAGIESGRRGRVQDAFISGQVNLVCATIAFGMGIDKSDVRFVVHYNMPGNLEGFYQEIGRAGRDGEPAETLLFYSYADVLTHQRFAQDTDNAAYREIQTAKLTRMKAYAEAQLCRRKILLSYFSETPAGDCGYCDVCLNPPIYQDGTRLAQMALSAMARAEERLNLTTLVDVLKGTTSPAVTHQGWDKIKTFGAGREVTAFAWSQYIQQFLQQGIIELDYRDHGTLKHTALSEPVLRGTHPVRLVSLETLQRRQEAQKDEAKAAKDSRVTPTRPVDEGLFEQLRACRKEIANQIRKPAFVVFSDATLRDMAARQPTTMAEFLEVSGVGEFKAKKYGKQFLAVVQAHQG